MTINLMCELSPEDSRLITSNATMSPMARVCTNKINLTYYDDDTDTIVLDVADDESEDWARLPEEISGEELKTALIQEIFFEKRYGRNTNRTYEDIEIPFICALYKAKDYQFLKRIEYHDIFFILSDMSDLSYDDAIGIVGSILFENDLSLLSIGNRLSALFKLLQSSITKGLVNADMTSPHAYFYDNYVKLADHINDIPHPALAQNIYIVLCRFLVMCPFQIH